MQASSVRGVIVFIIVFLLAIPAILAFKKQHIVEPIGKGPGVHRVVMLSDYFDRLKDSVADTEIYILEGEKPGATIFVWGMTHPVEPAGMLASVLLVENAMVSQGRLLVMPRANKAGMTNTQAGQGSIAGFNLKTKSGAQRYFRFGGRGMNPLFQWPDPDVYVNLASGQALAGDESRNLNRVHPGRPNGYLTEQISYAMLSLIRKEKVDVAIDLHEAPPDRPLVNAVAVHERALKLAALTNLNLELQGIKIRLELSPKNLRGLSHREIGDHTAALAMLFEVQSPYHGPLRGRGDMANYLTAKDEFLELASRMGRTSVQHTKEGVPFDLRVARHVTSVVEVANAFTELNPAKPIKIEEVPSYEEISKNGVGYYLREIE